MWFDEWLTPSNFLHAASFILYHLSPLPPSIPLQACELQDSNIWAAWAANASKGNDAMLLPPRVNGKVWKGWRVWTKDLGLKRMKCPKVC